jgi:HK97 family phage prohead protease
MSIIEEIRRVEPLLGDRQVRRSLASERVEVRAANGYLTFDGLASSTSMRQGSITNDGNLIRDNGYDMGWYTERIMQGAFTKTLSENPDVQLLINHEGLPLARTSNGTLDLRENPERGLEFVARVDENDPDAQMLARKVETGLMDQCSFAFRITRREWDETKENMDILEVNMNRGDVSVVNYGANPATAVAVRSLLVALADLNDDEIDELRNDPTVMRLATQLVHNTPVLGDTSASDEHLIAHVRDTLSTDLARARAYAYRTKSPRR